MTTKKYNPLINIGLDTTANSVNDLSDHTKAVHDALNIDADTLDSLDSTAFALSGHNHNLADLTEKAHSSLTDVTANQHHNQVHAIDGADHTGNLAASAITNTPAGDIASVNVQTAINELDTEKSAVGHNHDLLYAPIASGVTNGNLHDHIGGDGAQIDHVNLTNKGTNTHAEIDTHISAAGDYLPLAGGIMSGDLEFSGTAALEIADNAYAFKYKGDNDAGLVFSATNAAYEFRDTLASPVFRVFLSGIIKKGTTRVSTQFDKTNATVAAITGLGATLRAGLTYKFKAHLFVDASALGGSKYTIAMSPGSATNVIYQITLLDNNTNAYTITSRQTALLGAAGQAGTTAGLCIIEGLITVGVAGNFVPAFAQNAASGTSSILVGSTFEIEEVA